MVVGGFEEDSFLDESIGCNCRDTSKVGVLGGVGPESTGVFYSKLIRSLQERKVIESNTDFLQIVVNSIPAPELIYGNISRNELKPYIEGLCELDGFGVDFIVMVCNTIHLYHGKLQSETDAPILDLKNKVRKLLKKRNVGSALILGTPSTIKQGLYRFEEINSYEPTQEEMEQLIEAIHNYNKGVEKTVQIKKVGEISQKYLNKGAEAVIAGCTEFATMLEEENIQTINTIDVLVNMTVEKILDEGQGI